MKPSDKIVCQAYINIISSDTLDGINKIHGLFFKRREAVFSKQPQSSAAKEIRTPTPFRALPPQSSASTNFAIAAFFAKLTV
jgi:hypothetical protein